MSEVNEKNTDDMLFNSMAFPEDELEEPAKVEGAKKPEPVLNEAEVVSSEEEEDFQYDEVREEEFEVVAQGIQAKNDKAGIRAYVEKEMKEIVANSGNEEFLEKNGLLNKKEPASEESYDKKSTVDTTSEDDVKTSIAEENGKLAEKVVDKDIPAKKEEKISGAEEEEQLHRAKRKSRRIRTQIVCYIVIMALLVISGVGIAWGFETWTENNRLAKKIAMANKETQMSAMEVLVESEAELVSPEESEEPESQEPAVEPSTEPTGTDVEEPVETQPVDEVTPTTTAGGEYVIAAKERTPQETKLDEMIDQMIAEMSLQDKVAGLFVITPEALTKNNTVTKAAGGTKSALTKYPVGGLIYAKKNITAPAQVATMLKNTAEYATYPLFLAVSEEGGSNGPLANAKACEKTSTAKEIGETGDTQNAFTAGSVRAEAMVKAGMNLNVLSIGNIANVENSIMDEFSFGADAETVVPYVTAMVNAMRSQGVHVCVGQFPGNGGVSASEEDGKKINNRSIEELKSQELTVFKAAVEAGAEIISVGTISVPAITGDNTPVVLSSAAVTDILRNEMGYQGVIISDALNVPEITSYYGADEAAVLALRAGCDMIYLPEKFDVAYNGVISAVEDGTIDENRINDALRRIYRVKYAEKLTNGEIQ